MSLEFLCCYCCENGPCVCFFLSWCCCCCTVGIYSTNLWQIALLLGCRCFFGGARACITLASTLSIYVPSRGIRATGCRFKLHWNKCIWEGRMIGCWSRWMVTYEPLIYWPSHDLKPHQFIPHNVGGVIGWQNERHLSTNCLWLKPLTILLNEAISHKLKALLNQDGLNIESSPPPYMGTWSNLTPLPQPSHYRCAYSLLTLQILV